ncbi:MAG: SDR family oxidoreductase, partial [Victivallales bacterium]|nr:SDR family oxidoreductase [Victivallales bacterium]
FDGIPAAADDILSRIDVIEGDLLTTNAAELAANEYCRGVSIIFHCAADVNLGKDLEKKTYNINYQGTMKMLELARRLQVKEFHYVSTAYVAGKRVGVAKEDELINSGFNNSYENSKFDSETMVRKSGLNFTIYRPSIIVGRLSDGKVRRPLAFYRILEFMAKLKKHHCAKLKLDPTAWMEMDLRFETYPSETVYFVPIDYVQRAIFSLFSKPVCNKTYHITGNSPVSVHDIARNISNTLKIRGVKVMEKVENPTADEKLISRFLGDLLPYYSSRIIFDQTNVREAMGDDFIAWKFDDEHLGIIMREFLRSFFPNVEWLQQL